LNYSQKWLKTPIFGYNSIYGKEEQHDNESVSFKGINLKSQSACSVLSWWFWDGLWNCIRHVYFYPKI